MSPGDEQRRGDGGACPHILPGDAHVRQNLEDDGEQERDDDKRQCELGAREYGGGEGDPGAIAGPSRP